MRRVLRREGVTPFEEERRIPRLHERRPRGRAVICFDEHGPLELRPMPGIAWTRVGHPRRL
ncbi:MAG: hypothetical protein RDU83_00275 [bacterium]|nr:hypothetical protein [bacterium]